MLPRCIISRLYELIHFQFNYGFHNRLFDVSRYNESLMKMKTGIDVSNGDKKNKKDKKKKQTEEDTAPKTLIPQSEPVATAVLETVCSKVVLGGGFWSVAGGNKKILAEEQIREVERIIGEGGDFAKMFEDGGDANGDSAADNATGDDSTTGEDATKTTDDDGNAKGSSSKTLKCPPLDKDVFSKLELAVQMIVIFCKVGMFGPSQLTLPLSAEIIGKILMEKGTGKEANGEE
jgi:hypothetical protein